MEDFIKKEHELMQFLYKSTNLQSLCNEAARLIGNPIVVGDFFWNKLVISSDFPKEDYDDQINRIRHTSQTKRSQDMGPLFDQLSDRQPHVLELAYMRNRRLMCGIFSRNKLIAYLESPDIGSSFDEIDHDFFRSCCNILGLALQCMHFPIDKARKHPYALLWNHFNHHSTKKMYEDLEFCPELISISKFQLFWLENSPNCKPFIDSFSRLPFQNWYLTLAEGTCILAEAPDASQLKQIQDLSEKHSVLLGASDTFLSLHQLDAATHQAQTCLRFANAAKNPGVFIYNSFKLQDLLAQAETHLSLEDFVDDTLAAVRSHDKEHQTEYELTMRTYLMNEQNLFTTAKLLFVHKNTIIYRINKLKELFDIDFNDCRKLAHLYCSFLIDETVNRKDIP